MSGLLLTALLSLALAASGEETLESRSELLFVNCFDEAREIVQRALPGECRGRVVNDEEAEQIRQRRRAYVQRAIAADADSAVSGRRLKGIGSGFFVDGRGMVLTSYHVVRDCGVISVSPAVGGTQAADILASEPQNDLALLKTDNTVPYAAAFAPEEAPVADTLVILGYATRGVPPVRPLGIAGTLLKPRSTGPVPSLLAFKADVRPGNSGGPILDPAGRVVGVVIRAVDTPAIYRRTGRIIREVGLAVPNRTVAPFLARSGVVHAIREVAIAQDDVLGYARSFVTRVECWD